MAYISNRYDTNTPTNTDSNKSPFIYAATAAEDMPNIVGSSISWDEVSMPLIINTLKDVWGMYCKNFFTLSFNCLSLRTIKGITLGR